MLCCLPSSPPLCESEDDERVVLEYRAREVLAALLSGVLQLAR
jgi:hypothetical protein